MLESLSDTLVAVTIPEGAHHLDLMFRWVLDAQVQPACLPVCWDGVGWGGGWCGRGGQRCMPQRSQRLGGAAMGGAGPPTCEVVAADSQHERLVCKHQGISH